MLCVPEPGLYTSEDGLFTPQPGMPWLAGRYKVLEVIGKGQSSVVLKAQVSGFIIYIYFYQINFQWYPIVKDHAKQKYFWPL